MKNKLLSCFLWLTSTGGFAQITPAAYVDLDYISTFSKEQIRPLAYEQPAANQLSLNHMIIGVDYRDTTTTMPVEAHLSLQAGDYVGTNYASEPLLLRHIYDANLAVHVHKYITIAGGIFGNSYLGAVSTKSIENKNPSFAVGTDYVPYYITGGSVTFSKSDKFSAMIGIFNGYQRIRDNNSSVSPGFQVTWTPNETVRLNLAGIVGNEADQGQPAKIKSVFTPDITLTASPISRVLVAGAYGRFGSAQWFNVTISPQVDISKRFKWSMRAEYLNDAQSALGLDPSGVNVGNISTNFDCWITPKLVVRIEGRYFSATRCIYNGKSEYGMLGIFAQFKL